jgi:hypothetical protein
VASSGISSPALLPSSSEASSGAAQWVLGMVCLVEVGLKPGKRASSAPATPGLRPRDLHQFLGRGPSRMSSSRRSCDQLQPKLRGERPSGGVLQELIQPGVVSGGNGSCSWIRGGGGSPPGSQTGPHTAAGSIVLSPCQVRCPNEALEHDGVQTENSEN